MIASSCKYCICVLPSRPRFVIDPGRQCSHCQCPFCVLYKVNMRYPSIGVSRNSPKKSSSDLNFSKLKNHNEHLNKIVHIIFKFGKIEIQRTFMVGVPIHLAIPIHPD